MSRNSRGCAGHNLLIHTRKNDGNGAYAARPKHPAIHREAGTCTASLNISGRVDLCTCKLLFHAHHVDKALTSSSRPARTSASHQLPMSLTLNGIVPSSYLQRCVSPSRSAPFSVFSHRDETIYGCNETLSRLVRERKNPCG